MTYDDTHTLVRRVNSQDFQSKYLEGINCCSIGSLLGTMAARLTRFQTEVGTNQSQEG